MRPELTETHDSARASAMDFAMALAGSWQKDLGPRMLGVYLIGSLAHGGFNRRYSDIDMAVVAKTGLGDDDLAAMRAAAAAQSPALASKLSIFWADRSFALGRFPPLDRLDLLDHAVALMEFEAVRPERPPLEAVRAYLRGAPFETWTNNAAKFAELETLDPENHKPYLRAHLYPARFVYSWVTGRVASNDVAVAFLRENPPDGLDVGLVAQAMRCRDAADDPDMLFADRSKLPAQVGACARLLPGD